MWSATTKHVYVSAVLRTPFSFVIGSPKLSAALLHLSMFCFRVLVLILLHILLCDSLSCEVGPTDLFVRPIGQFSYESQFV